MSHEPVAGGTLSTEKDTGSQEQVAPLIPPIDVEAGTYM